MEAKLHEPVRWDIGIEVMFRTSKRSMADKQTICKQPSLNTSNPNTSSDESLANDEDMDQILQEIENRNNYPSLKNAKKRDSDKMFSRAESFAKDEDMDRILNEIDDQSKYNPSSKYDKKRTLFAGNEGIPPDEELNQFFVDVEKRNEELKELLQVVENSSEGNGGRQSRINSASAKGSSDSLVEQLMRQELHDDDKDKKGLNSKFSCKANRGRKLATSASEQELDQMLAELLEL
ncbi:uncharacterized protein [Montipora capricornis]|uniref:uncharacterized protein n=1 Tax=Montipora foliosa TaxID=591990 RepID=UPI0035F100F0